MSFQADERFDRLRDDRSDISSDEDEQDAYVPPKNFEKHRESTDDEEEEGEVEEGDRKKSQHERKSRRDSARSTFANALLKAGTKSTKDSSLDKPIRKSAGLLLETAGRSLLQKSAKSTNKLSSGHHLPMNSQPKSATKLSFGLYGGHLAVDHGSYSKSGGSDSDGDSLGSATAINLLDKPPKKVFSNWGGEFFKKNLDYRANTNKILEKMNLGSSNNGVGQGSTTTTTTSVRKDFSDATSPTLTSFVPGERFKALLSATSRGGPGLESGTGNNTSQAKKTNSFLDYH